MTTTQGFPTAQQPFWARPSPAPMLCAGVRGLAACGADLIAIPCNTAHYYYNEIVAASPVPVLSILTEAVGAIKRQEKHRAALLATAGTYQSGIYQRAFKQGSVELIMPDTADQEFFYRLAYQVKAGDKNYDKEGLLARLQVLRNSGAQCFVLGCTEIPVAFADMGIADDVIDTSLELARAALLAAGYEVKKMKKAVYFFCPLKELDVCAAGVMEKVKSLLPLQESGLVVDDMPAYMYVDGRGDRFDFVSCDYYLSHRYDKYLPMMNGHFADYDIAGYVNWHGGANAPDKVLTVHTIGDVITGKFAPSNPVYTKNLAVALEKWRANLGLEDFTTYTEATHWSGAIHGSDTGLLEQFPVPMLDIEIGSEQETLQNPVAQEAIARALTEVFASEKRPKAILALGGIHFDRDIFKFPEGCSFRHLGGTLSAHDMAHKRRLRGGGGTCKAFPCSRNDRRRN